MEHLHSILRRLQAAPTGGMADTGGHFTTEIVPLSAQGVSTIAVNILMFLCTTVWTVLRIRVRRAKGQAYMFEDLLCVIALVRGHRLLMLMVSFCADFVRYASDQFLWSACVQLHQ